VKAVFFDTWAWIAMANGRDEYHGKAMEFYREFNKLGGTAVTTDYVRAETFPAQRKALPAFPRRLTTIPFLQIIGVKHLSTTAATEPENVTVEKGRIVGAYAWCKYGYINHEIESIKNDFLRYVQKDRKVSLTDEEIDDIRHLRAMHRLAGYLIERNGNKLKVGKDFLLGDDGTGRFSREILWQGIIPDISDKTSPGMVVLSERLVLFKRK
jgi:hypothetical protein